ncbi:MAG: hypothetical protein D6719_07035 [Candidatus Dadabacteria bacterium]|nr:MAG: hypothetical protein D6719_07035 [Candidatus Dadabacteria bacterium]
MKNNNKWLEAANQTDCSAVGICFKDKAVSELFAALVACRGYETVIIESPDELPADARLITEQHYLSSLTEDLLPRALIVGKKPAIENIAALKLYQPLTEEKIEKALHQLFSHQINSASAPSY